MDPVVGKKLLQTAEKAFLIQSLPICCMLRIQVPLDFRWWKRSVEETLSSENDL